MPIAPAAKGLILASSVLFAAGVAAYEANPAVREFIDNLRKEIAAAWQDLVAHLRLQPTSVPAEQVPLGHRQAPSSATANYDDINADDPVKRWQAQRKEKEERLRQAKKKLWAVTTGRTDAVDERTALDDPLLDPQLDGRDARAGAIIRDNSAAASGRGGGRGARRRRGGGGAVRDGDAGEGSSSGGAARASNEQGVRGGRGGRGRGRGRGGGRAGRQQAGEVLFENTGGVEDVVAPPVADAEESSCAPLVLGEAESQASTPPAALTPQSETEPDMEILSSEPDMERTVLLDADAQTPVVDQNNAQLLADNAADDAAAADSDADTASLASSHVTLNRPRSDAAEDDDRDEVMSVASTSSWSVVSEDQR